MPEIKKRKKTAVVAAECVGCGNCAKICPLGAISVPDGVRALVNTARCVGCGKCARECPASVIELCEAEA